ncbi:MAG: GNAT family N-acetyltransferase [Rhodobiaceae bacterium]|nr:GNAT family N-acetyltransferase [Rhodobiaceae bacterium]
MRSPRQADRNRTNAANRLFACDRPKHTIWTFSTSSKVQPSRRTRLLASRFRHFIAADTADLIVAEIAGNAVGYALVLFRHGTALARLYSIAVQPGMAGKGHCRGDGWRRTARLQAQLCIAMRQKCEDNLGAIRLYERRGTDG